MAESDNKVIEWTPEMLKRFKAARKVAVEKAEVEFNFDGNTFLTSYAMYLIEYLDGQLK